MRDLSPAQVQVMFEILDTQRALDTAEAALQLARKERDEAFALAFEDMPDPFEWPS